jgi:hypothetical protein
MISSPAQSTIPYVVKHGAVQVDGVAAEINIDPASTFQEFSYNLQQVLLQLQDMIPGYEILQLQPLFKLILMFCLSTSRCYPVRLTLTHTQKNSTPSWINKFLTVVLVVISMSVVFLMVLILALIVGDAPCEWLVSWIVTLECPR